MSPPPISKPVKRRRPRSPSRPASPRRTFKNQSRPTRQSSFRAEVDRAPTSLLSRPRSASPMPRNPDKGANKPPGATPASPSKPEIPAPRSPGPVPPVAAANQGGKIRPPAILKPVASIPEAAGLDPEAVMKLNGLAARLNTLDYFQILNIEKNATPVEIKTAFHRWSRAYHPDRFYQLADKELKLRVNEVYKRITEAYYILRDDGKRKAYLTDISGPERIQKLRFTEASELGTKAAIRKEHDEQIGTHPKGRQFFQTCMTDF